MSNYDLITPILPEDYRREIGPKVWHWNQIYFGADSKLYDSALSLERYVPAVDDIVMHPQTGDWVVNFVSETHIPSFRPRQINLNDSDVNDQIVVPSKSYNRRADVLHIDVTTLPIRFYVNSRIWVNGSQASHFKIFTGTNISENGVSIAATYNANGQIVSDSVELELVAFDRDNVTNRAIKTPKAGYLREIPASDDLVTLVIYAQDGSYIDSQVLVVSHENFIPSSAATRYITEIALDTPYLSESDDKVIEVKRNMLLQSLALFGIVRYNDGSFQRLPVGGKSKFQLHGMEAFTASNDLHEVDVVLSYSMGADEAGVKTTGTLERSKTEAYTVRTMPSDAAYSVKLFVVPTWNRTTAKWELRYKLYDLKRDNTKDVTSLVEQSTDYKFNPDLYSQQQTVQVAINLMNVGPQYQFYRPVQTFNITLIRPGEIQNVPAYYLLSYSANLQMGNGLVANRNSVGGKTMLNLSCGFTTLEDWITGIYKHLGVLYTGDTPAPPNPTKFRLRKNSNTDFTEYAMSNITKNIEVTGAWAQGDTALVEFFAESAGDTLELATLALNVNITN